MKAKFVKLIAFSLLFLLGVLWIFGSLAKTFRTYAAENNLKQITLFARSAPADPALYESWVATVSETITGGRALAFRADEAGGAAGDLTLAGGGIAGGAAGGEAERAVWESLAGSEEGTAALESVYYGIPWKSAGLLPVGGAGATGADAANGGAADITRCRAYLLPLTGSDGYELAGALFVLAPEGAVSSYERLIYIFAAIAFVLFVVIFAITLFARDPITGYSVLFLFAVSAAFIAFPLFEAFRLSFLNEGRPSLAVWKRALTPEFLLPLIGSVKLGLITASVSTLIGFAFAFLTERTGARHKKFISTMATLPVISPPFSLTLSIILLFGNNGLITRQLLHLDSFSIYGLGGLVLVQTIGMFPIAYMTLASVLRSIDSTLEDAALDLRAGRLQTFLTVTLPLALPGLLSAWLLVFTNSLADFANPLLLAGSYRVLSVEAYIQVNGRNDLGGGAALSLLLLLPTLTAFFAQRYWVNRKSFVTITGKPNSRLAELAPPAVRRTLTAFVWCIMLFIVALYGTILAGCFVKNWGIDYSFTLSNIGEALSRGKQAIGSTVVLALAATPIAGILAMAAALIIVRQTFFGKRLLEVLLMTPFAVPGTLIGISYVLAFNKPPLLLIGTAAIIVINYVIRELPVGLETGAASLRQIDKSIEEAARDLGADTSKVFTSIVLPLVRPAFLTSMSYTFVRSMTAVSAVVFLISPKWYHITMQIFNFSESLRFGYASVLATTLIIIVLAAFGLMRLIVGDTAQTQKTVSR